MVEELLKQHQKLKTNLNKAILHNDIELVGKFDKEISELWDEIFSFVPECAADSRLLLRFLITQINELLDYSNHVEQITDKIFNLYDYKSCN